MVWDQLSINKPHLVYIILGGFTSIFMLVSLFIKEKMYIGEATVATIVGLIFGPHAANLINPLDWGNTDQITLEFSRIVLVVQCFAVGVELPKAYMERHWASVTLLLVPVMTFGWLITSLFIWWMIEPLTWLESLCCAACVTATDPVLASSVVGKGKFAKRVPKHIRDLLSAESGCNDGMAFPFIYLALNLIHYHLDAAHVTFHWFCYTILYECIWGATYGVLVGYAGRHAIKLAERRGLIDRESFLVFYFVLALFCAGSGSLLGMDDLLVGFAAGVGFSNDGWFTAKTEESHVSNVIDLLLNLTYFVYLGTIIPWDQFNSPIHGLQPWRLVVIAILVIFFRRIPIMLMLKPIIPDIKTWREALFCGHFGPIGVGAIFVAILARAELETSSTTPLDELPDPSVAEYVLIYTIWPITTFLVITSIIVHGSSIAVFTLGRRINTLTMTISFTQGNDQSSKWMDRLPRITSQSRSMSRADSSDIEDEKLNLPPGQLPPIGMPQFALRRQKDEDYNKPAATATGRTRSRPKRRGKKKYENMGGYVDPSAIEPARRSDPTLLSTQESNSDTLREKSEQESPEPDAETLERLRSDDTDSDSQRRRKRASDVEAGKLERKETHGGKTPPDVEAYDEGDKLIVEDAEGNVITTAKSEGLDAEGKARVIDAARAHLAADTSGKYTNYKHEPHPANEGEAVKQEVEHAAEHPEKTFRDAFKGWKGFGGNKHGEEDQAQPKRARGPAHAYQIGNTIIVEDEDGEVIKKIVIPRGEGEVDYNKRMREGMRKMSTWVGMGRRSSMAIETPEASKDTVAATEEPKSDASTKPAEQKKDPKPRKRPDLESLIGEDDGLRMVISRQDRYGLTGYHKPKVGDRPDMVTMGGGRRMSTKDFLSNMSHMDQSSRIAAIDSSDAPDDIKAAARRGDFRRPSEIRASAKPSVQRSSTMPTKSAPGDLNKPDEATDYFSKQPTTPPASHERFQADIPSPPDPQPKPPNQRQATSESLDTIGEEEVPTHNVRDTVVRHGQGMTDAERRRAQAARVSRIPEDQEDEEDEDESPAERRRRLAALRSTREASREEDEEESPAERRRRQAALRTITQSSGDDDDYEGETAAERRRRLAALGVKSADDDDSSSESDEEGPRIPKSGLAIPEPEGSPYDTRRQQQSETPEEEAAPAPRMKIQWGGETRGHVRGEKDNEDGPSSSSGSKSKLKGFFKNKT